MRNAAERNPKNLNRWKLFPILLSLIFAFQTTADQIIIDRELAVLRADFKEVHYLISKNVENGKLQGSFSCRGGFYDDINFLIFTKDQYVRWYSNYSHKPIFKLEKKKEGKFEFPVKVNETYYFVFDNFFSTVSNKQVKLQVKLVSTDQAP